MRDDLSSRRMAAQNARQALLAADCRPTPYGPAIAIGLSLVAWAMIIATVVYLL